MSATALAVIPMTTEEARDRVEAIKNRMTNLQRCLLELYERQGWKALGYASWRDCVTSEFSYSVAHVYRLLYAAQVERNISPIGEISIRESQARELAPLSPDQQRELAQRTDFSVVTAHQLRQEVQQMCGVPCAPPEHLPVPCDPPTDYRIIPAPVEIPTNVRQRLEQIISTCHESHGYCLNCEEVIRITSELLS